MRGIVAAFVALCFASTPSGLRAETADVPQLCATVKQVGPRGLNHRATQAAVEQLSRLEPENLPALLAGMDGAGPLATNWLGSAFEAAADRALKAGRPLPQAGFEAFLADTHHAPQARRLAYEWIVRLDPSAAQRLVPTFLQDPSLELRRDAVALALAQAEALAKSENKTPTINAYQRALAAARDLDQVQAAAKALRELGAKVDLAEHFGFIRRWQLVGPFDNHDKMGFDTPYPPEKEIQLGATLTGKDGPVSWREFTTTDELGNVDLNKAIAKHMGAVAYAYAEFDSPVARPIELRLGTENGNKVWLNGELLTANQVYHANTSLDQYIGRGHLQAGKNRILVKICQNEQTEDWAQDWKFQLRVCDALGTAVLPNAAP